MASVDLVTRWGPRMPRGRRARVASYLALAASAAALAAGLAIAFLTVNGSGTGSASTGTVTLSVNAPATHTCTYSSLEPGDLTGAGTCALSVTYGGTIPAFVSVTVAVQSKAGVGGHSLYDGSGSAGLTLSISDGNHAFIVPTGAGTTGGSCPAGFRCWTAGNDLAAWYSGSTPNLSFSSTSPAVTWTVTPLFPRAVGNPYQGGTATLTLTAQAVQTPANPLPAGCTTATIGAPCPASGGFTWS